jgi:sortase A
MISILNPVPQPSRIVGGKVLAGLAPILMLEGIMLLGYVAYLKADELFYQRTEIVKLRSSPIVNREQRLANDLLRPRPVIGDVLGELQVPRIGLKAIVVEGDSSKLLRRAVGHVPDTALPGQSGNIALAGHRDSLFRPLRLIRQGDLVIFGVKDQRFQYEVQSTEIVSPENVAVLQPTLAHELTLITCFPFGYVGAAPNRFIVHAHEREISQ